MLKKEDIKQGKDVLDQIKTSVIQGLALKYGPEFVIRVTGGEIRSDTLHPAGEQLHIKLQVDVYPKS